MTDFEKSVCADMRSADRVGLWISKFLEIKELSQIMTDSDVDLLKRVLQQEASK